MAFFHILVQNFNGEVRSLGINMTDVISCNRLCFLQFDLVNTIGEAAALGAAGVVSWGDMNVTDTEVESGGS